MLKELVNDLDLRFNENTNFDPFDIPLNRDHGIKHTFLFCFQLLRGTSQPQTKWYKPPVKKQAGLLDYFITMPVEITAMLLIGAASFIGASIPFLLIIIAIIAIENNIEHNHNRDGLSSTAFLEGWIIGSWLNSDSSGLEVLSVLGAIACGSIAYGVLMPIRWMLNEGLVTALAGIIAGVVALPVYVGQKIASAYQARFRNDQPAVNNQTPSSTRAIQQNIELLQHTTGGNIQNNTPNDSPPPYAPPLHDPNERRHESKQTQPPAPQDDPFRPSAPPLEGSIDFPYSLAL